MSICQTSIGTSFAYSTAVPTAADADLLLRLGIALAARQRAAWRVVRLKAQHGVVRLEGIVPTFYDRQLIVAVAQHVAGVLRVEDELAIAEPPARKQDAAAASSPPPNAFRHLPVLADSLEDILARRARDAAAAG